MLTIYLIYLQMSQLKVDFEIGKNAVGEQQGYLLVKIIGRNTEKVETFLLTTTGKTFDYTICYRLEIKFDQFLKSHL